MSQPTTTRDYSEFFKALDDIWRGKSQEPAKPPPLDTLTPTELSVRVGVEAADYIFDLRLQLAMWKAIASDRPAGAARGYRVGPTDPDYSKVIKALNQAHETLVADAPFSEIVVVALGIVDNAIASLPPVQPRKVTP